MTEKPTSQQLEELMRQFEQGRITGTLFERFLEKPEQVLLLTEPKIETVTIAGYVFEQTTYSDGSRKIELGEFEIDYDEPLAQKIAAAGFVEKRDPEHPDTYNRNITDKNFPYKETGKKMVRLALLNTGRDAQTSEAFKKLTTRLGRCKGDLAQLLAVAKRYHELQRKLYILACGSHWHNYGEPDVVPALDGTSDKRWLSLNDFGIKWRDVEWGLVAG